MIFLYLNAYLFYVRLYEGKKCPVDRIKERVSGKKTAALFKPKFVKNE